MERNPTTDILYIVGENGSPWRVVVYVSNPEILRPPCGF
jgi:hypothetical protein